MQEHSMFHLPQDHHIHVDLDGRKAFLTKSALFTKETVYILPRDEGVFRIKDALFYRTPIALYVEFSHV